MTRHTLCLAILCQAFITSGIVSGETTSQANLKHFPAMVQVSEPLLNRAWSSSRDGWNSFDTPHYQSMLTGSHPNFWPDPVPGIRAQYYSLSNVVYSKSLLNAGLDALGDANTAPLHWPTVLEVYYQYSGDEAFVETLVRTGLPRWLATMSKRSDRKKSLIRSNVPWPNALTVGLPEDTVMASADPITNAFYYRSLLSAQRLQTHFGLYNLRLATLIEDFQSEYRNSFWDQNTLTYSDGSAVVNAVALTTGLLSDDGMAQCIQLIRKQGLTSAPMFHPYLIEACFIAGETQLGIDLLTFTEEFEQNPAALYLIPEYLIGLKPGSPGWSTITVAPRLTDSITSAELQIPVPDGRVSLRYDAGEGYTITIPVDARVIADTAEGQNMVIKKYRSHTRAEPLSQAEKTILAEADWDFWVIDGDAAIWISIDDQMLRIVDNGVVTYQARCASAEKGVGSMMNSLKTPLGWHGINKKIGADADWGQVFRSRQATREVWQPGEDTKEDLVLTRVLLLDGLEKGLNMGGNVDSMARHIYIHGTNDEARIGTPSSHGCIRMTNDDVIEAFDIIPEGMKVLITASSSETSTD